MEKREREEIEEEWGEEEWKREAVWEEKEEKNEKKRI